MSDKSNKQSPDYDRAYDPDVADADLTDLEYLRRQGERAKAAIMGAASAIKSTATEGASDVAARFNRGAGGDGTASDNGPLNVVREHPWYSVGTATAVGFVGAWFLKPTKKRGIHKRIRDLEKRLKEQEASLPSGGGDATTKAAKSSIWASLGTLVVTHGMQAIKPLMTDVIAPMMAGRMQPEGESGGHMPGGPYAGMHPDAAQGGFQGGGMPPDVEAAMRAQHYGSQQPPRSAGDPSI